MPVGSVPSLNDDDDGDGFDRWTGGRLFAEEGEMDSEPLQTDGKTACLSPLVFPASGLTVE